VRDFDQNLRPNSEDPVFSDAWKKSGGEKEIVEATIDRWINQIL
jgi:hypothetical protein